MRLSALSIAALYLFAAVPSRAATPPPLAAATQSKIESVARKDLQLYGGKQAVPGAFIALWMPGKQPFVKSVGYADLPKRKAFTLPDKFRIGSNTKTFVITVLLQLVDEKRLKLDDPVSKFDIGVKVPNGQNITVRQLCEMRSGLYEAYNVPQIQDVPISPQTRMDPKKILALGFQHKPLFPPGTKYNYSNTNYLILGLIIESLTHDTIAHQIQKRLLDPLALHDTSFPLYDPYMPKPYSHGYGLNKSGAWEDVTVDLPPSLTWAAGAMISTVPDMKRWVKSYVLGTMNSAASQRQRLNCLPVGAAPNLGFGLGIGCSEGWYGYTGGLSGYNTGAYYLPSKDVTLIVFVNAQREKPAPGVANRILRDISQIVTPQNVLFP